MGSLTFLWLVVQLLAASHSLLVALTWLALDQQTFFRHQYYNICTVGFNNILFGMKTVAILSVQDRQPHMTGIYIPGKVNYIMFMSEMQPHTGWQPSSRRLDKGRLEAGMDCVEYQMQLPEPVLCSIAFC